MSSAYEFAPPSDRLREIFEKAMRTPDLSIRERTAGRSSGSAAPHGEGATGRTLVEGPWPDTGFRPGAASGCREEATGYDA